MVKLPRAEQRSIYTPADMPHLAGDGWTAPARALQGLGKAIGSLGGALADAEDQVDPRQMQEAKLAQLEFINTWNKDELGFRATYAGDGKDYGASRTGLFEQRSQEFMQQWPDPIRRRLAIPQERFRGSVQQDAYSFGYTRYNDTLYSNTGRAITGEMGKFAAYVENPERLNLYRENPEMFSADLEAHIQSMDAIIDGLPLVETRKDALRNEAAQQLEDALSKLPSGVTLGTARQQIERFSAPRVGDGPSGPPVPAEPGDVTSGLYRAPGIEIEPRVKADAPYMRRARDVAGIRRIIMHGDVSESVDNLVRYGQRVDKARGFDPNYHFYIGRDGRIVQGVPLDRRANHTRGNNSDTIGIVVAGADGGKMPTAAQEAAAKRLIASLGKTFRIDPKNVIGHGELQPGRRHKMEGGTIAADIRAHGYDSIGAPPAETAGAPGVRVNLTAYSPKAGGDRMEGGYAAARPGPDGKAEVRTLADVAAGRSEYVTIAGNPRDYGKTYTIPEISFVDGSGKTQTLRNVKAVVHDTGSAFKNAPEGRFDVPIDRDATDKQMAASHGLWKKAGVQFVPDSRDSGGDTSPIVTGSVGSKAGLAIVTAADEALAGRMQAGTLSEEDRAKVARVLNSAFLKRTLSEEARQAAAAAVREKSPDLARRIEETKSIAGLPLEDRRTVHRALIDSGLMTTASGGAAAPKSPESPETPESPATPPPSPEPAPPATDGGTIRTGSGEVRVAGEPRDPQSFRGSVANHLAERLIKRLPALEQKHRAEVAAQVKTVADRAARGEIIPADEEKAIRTELGRLNDDKITTAFEMALAAARTTAQFKQLPPAALETLTLQMRARATAEGTSAGMSAQIAAMEQLHDTMVKELKADPLGWAVEAGVLPGLSPLAPTPEALAERAMAAGLVAQHYGPQFYAAFTEDERALLAETLNQGGPESAMLLTGITQAFGQDTPRVMAEFAKDAPEAALLGWLIHAGGDSETIKDATDALALRRSEGFKSIAPNAVVARKTAIEVVGSAFQELPKNEQFATDLANLLYEVRARRAGAADFDADLWKKGFNEALGANTDPATGITYGGIAYNDPNWLFAGGSDPFIAPANVDAARVRELLDTVRITDLVEGGMPVDVEAPETDVETTAAAVGVQGFANIPALTALQQKGLPVDDKGRPVSIATLRRARLVTVGDGRYFLAMGSDEDPRYIRTPTGENYVLDLKALEPVLSERRPDLYRLR